MLVTLLHLGALHPVERLLVLLVAFGPFVVLAVVVYVVRRRDIAEEERDGRDGPSGRRPARPGRRAPRLERPLEQVADQALELAADASGSAP